MYSCSLQPSVLNLKGNQGSSQGDRKPKTLKYSCKVFYPALRINRECDWVKHRKQSYALISDISPNVQMHTNRRKVIERKN